MDIALGQHLVRLDGMSTLIYWICGGDFLEKGSFDDLTMLMSGLGYFSVDRC